MIAVDRAGFFAVMRRDFGRLQPEQVAATEFLLDQFIIDPLVTDKRHAAYLLATVWHETAQTMRPIAEFGKGRGRAYGVRGPHRGQVAYGRGYVQLTWATNYARADRELGLDGALIADYDLAMEPAIAYQILVTGMYEGWFTGKRLADYIRVALCDYHNARRIINGVDCAAKIAGHARHFFGALTA